MRVLLVSTNRVRHPYPVYPLGLDHVASALLAHHEARVLDLCPHAPGFAPLAAAIAEFRPDAVGVSIRNVDNTDFTAARDFSGAAREAVAAIRAETAAPVVLGGAGYSLFPREFLRRTGADWGFVGEGEASLPLFDALAEGRSPRGLPGVAGPDGEPPEPARAGGRVPQPEPGLNPAMAFYLARGGMLGLQTQRGCPFRCTYCTYPLIEGSRARSLDAEAAAARARSLESLGARHLVITDSVFNAHPEHSLEVAQAFRRARVGVPWSAYFAPGSPPPQLFERLAASGLSHVEFGTESLSDAMLPRIGKSFRKSDVVAAHRAARAAGLHVAHFLLFGGPGETAETVQASLDAADELEGAVFFVFSGMRIYPGTGLWRRAAEEGQVRPGDDLLEPLWYRPAAIPLEDIAARVLEHAARSSAFVVGDGAKRVEEQVAQLHGRGHTGPLWEWLAVA
ncbi:MAG TPA: lipid biosynthesis B12-binding/radical SAM protein [Anaeromyxobacteraceae bacterium]|nr:lipid biosynthesis B12-binding/radical SAM protein [Anaeromyxobacteraceae bacterium]